MKRLFLLLSLIAAPLAAQEVAYRPADVIKGRFSSATVPNPFPMTLIDEENLDRAWEVPYPVGPWNEAMHCLARMGIPVKRAGTPPPLVIIPYVNTFRVRDLTIDSIITAQDSTAVTGRLSAPTVGYTLYRSDVVLVAERFRTNRITLRHEAIHMILWRSARIWGHLPNTIKYFLTCDENFGDQA